jgi:hypothetical protein
MSQRNHDSEGYAGNRVFTETVFRVYHDGRLTRAQRQWRADRTTSRARRQARLEQSSDWGCPARADREMNTHSTPARFRRVSTGRLPPPGLVKALELLTPR